MNLFSKYRALLSQTWCMKMILCNLLIVVLCLPAVSTFAATQQVYEYDASGRLTTMYTADQKTTYSYDKNGNLIGKHQVVQGDSTTPEPTTDPTLIPPPVPVPTKSGLPTEYWIDHLEQTKVSTTCGGVRVSGWYLNPAGIKKIEIYIDGVFRGRAYMGDSREDVYDAYPAYNNHIAGFHADNLGCTTSEIQRADGTKRIRTGKTYQQVQIRMINQADQVTTYNRSVRVSVVPPADQLPIQYWVDRIQSIPVYTPHGMIEVSGWYLDTVDLQQIEVLIDGEYHGRMVVGSGKSREDVYQAYPAYNNHTSGFNLSSIKIQTEGTPYTQRKSDGTLEVVPNVFNHLVELHMMNQQGDVTIYKSWVKIDLNR
ncbi:RHS repeat domain-containing protein [Paenibacillus campi]|uniref:RHS repeat domain-containing protein n=1 Tax=Paenibacillus campi TaxID=3106031 RepID=UPI002AFF1D0F|nr:RHS repeat domain-containing protein [Paenibacillus sp. SGZ-1009]